jgi:deazaflavin-dependent oxidoreductase (nitroreductase family)
MEFKKLPAGTHGARTPPGVVARLLNPVVLRVHRLTGSRVRGMPLLYLTTVGARSGKTRTNPLGRFDDGQGGWLVVASAGGAATHPGWYHNIAAHPEDVVADVGGVRHPVRVDQLDGAARDEAWQQIVATAPQFGGYQERTDRPLPVLRLTPTD